MNVLIVDDHPQNLAVLRAQLASGQHTVLEALDGVEALEILRSEPVDAVISDILMPRMDGYRLCLEVRNDARLKDLPFIFYTATYTSPADEKACFELGADRYLRKPVSLEDIQAALEAACSSTSGRRSRKQMAASPSSVMKEYSERLVTKLEEKNLELADIVERLHASESYYRMLFEQASDAIVVTDMEANYIDMNPVACELLGYSREELIGKSAAVALEPQEVQRLAPEIERLQRGDVLKSEWRMVRKDGRKLLVEAVARRLPDGRLQALMRDVTERRRAEDALRSRAADLERFHRLSVGRELKMVELKREVNRLARELGRPEPYNVDFAEAK